MSTGFPGLRACKLIAYDMPEMHEQCVGLHVQHILHSPVVRKTINIKSPARRSHIVTQPFVGSSKLKRLAPNVRSNRFGLMLIQGVHQSAGSKRWQQNIFCFSSISHVLLLQAGQLNCPKQARRMLKEKQTIFILRHWKQVSAETRNVLYVLYTF